MAKNSSFQISKFFLDTTTKYFLITYVFPLGATLMSGIFGVMQDILLMWVMVGMALVFGSLTTGMLRLSEWRHKHKIKDRLNCTGARMAVDINSDNMMMNFQVLNTAPFPITTEIKDLRTSIDQKIPTKEVSVGSRLVIPAGLTGSWSASGVSNTGAAFRSGKTIFGTVECLLRYGKGDDLIYEMLVDRKVNAKWDSKGELIKAHSFIVQS